jgi:hypothetical protein
LCVAATIGGPASSAAATSASVNLAGYSESIPQDAPIAAQFHVPLADCASVPRASMIVGVVLWASDGNRVDAGVLVQCRHHVATYTPVIDIDGHRYTRDRPVHPGDRMVAYYSQNGPESVVAVRDHHGDRWTFKRVQNEETIDHSGVGVIADRCTADGCAPIPPFSTFRFFDSYINSGSLAAATRSDLVSHAGARQAVPGPLTGSQQTRFGVRWRATCVPVAGHC